jgi:integrase
MPKLNNRPPKYCKLKKYAVVYLHGKTHYLGLYDSPESRAAYARLLAESQANPNFYLSKKEVEAGITIKELSAAFLDYAENRIDIKDYNHYCTIVVDFLLKLYGDSIPVDTFKPSCLKLVRDDMIQSRRFCRNTINKYTRRIVSLFQWGVENDHVLETTWRALKAVKSLSKGYPGTFDNPKREHVPDWVVELTLPFMPPTLRAMVQLQRMLAMRPNEIFKMRVGDIDRSREAEGLWDYRPGSYKTAEYVGEIEFPLGRPEQELIAPYLIGKKPEEAIFSPRTAVAERNAEKKAQGKAKPTPSRIARDKARAAKPRQYKEFYDENSYRKAIEYAIKKGNRQLPEDKQIPHWYPYLLRNSGVTEIELEHGLDKAQAQAGHMSANMTKRYSRAQKKQREDLALNRRNPFSKSEENKGD